MVQSKFEHEHQTKLSRFKEECIPSVYTVFRLCILRLFWHPGRSMLVILLHPSWKEFQDVQDSIFFLRKSDRHKLQILMCVSVMCLTWNNIRTLDLISRTSARSRNYDRLITVAPAVGSFLRFCETFFSAGARARARDCYSCERVCVTVSSSKWWFISTD